ncbi:3-mercaptopyruvate sulfurtransferase [Trichinella spiralis]|uniref:3-mercaptopyruvate sulfurtransferase n=1 Tax=Trichinella spiralis TaxID=6334 RepID=UPI0001EFC1CD|nr:3-mercaptopyruvate sulfurtransferase [Trichinella spiralis]
MNLRKKQLKIFILFILIHPINALLPGLYCGERICYDGKVHFLIINFRILFVSVLVLNLTRNATKEAKAKAEEQFREVAVAYETFWDTYHFRPLKMKNLEKIMITCSTTLVQIHHDHIIVKIALTAIFPFFRGSVQALLVLLQTSRYTESGRQDCHFGHNFVNFYNPGFSVLFNNITIYLFEQFHFSTLNFHKNYHLNFAFKEELRQEEEAIIIAVIREFADIRGGYEKPNLSATLAGSIILLPVYIYRWLRFHVRWFWKFTIQKQEYGTEEKLHLIRKYMNMSQAQFDVILICSHFLYCSCCKMQLISTIRRRAYHTIVNSSWLAEKLANSNEKNLRILHASREGCGDYAEKHIPKSVCFDLKRSQNKNSPYNFMLPESDFFSKPFTIKVIDFLIQAFFVEKRNYTCREQRSLVVTYEEILDNLDEEDQQIIDCRAPNLFRGDTTMSSTRGKRNFEFSNHHHFLTGISGHIPGAINVPLTRLVDPDSKLILDKDKLISIFENAGVDLHKSVICSCNSGIQACGILLLLSTLGKKDIKLYDGIIIDFNQHILRSAILIVLGSWTEWSQRADPENVEVD